MRIFKAKWFIKFAQKANIKDADLKAAADLIDRGESSADDLGGHVFKLRFARPGEGKRGGYRFILFFRKGERLFFDYAYPKSKLDDIEDDELREFKKLAKKSLGLTEEQIEARLKDGRLKEIKGK
ncbi:hypothetical protein FACS1894106_5670 [Spirochaetia bacterium]|nr:hypothetical protein FACS1894106_5670 [Spirochaetia bacterium]